MTTTKRIISVLLVIFLLFIFGGKVVLHADGVIASAITVVPGEDPSNRFGANWYSDYDDVKLYYTKESDTDFSNAKVSGECAAPYFGEPSSTWTTKGYEGKYRCQADMVDLEPNTKYIYKIGNTNFTNVRSFKTSGSNSALFGFIADPQLYSSGSPQNIYRTHLSDMLYFASSEYGRIPDLLLGGGDMVERGGDFPLWTYLLDNNESLYDMPIACSTGNHEYGDGNGASLGDARFYSAMYNNPKNGPAGKENVSYWFKWNNAIIFVWDNIPKNKTNYEKHYLWMKDVLEHNQYQFVICMFHFPIYGGSFDSDLMTDYTRPLLEELGVDICLSGHDHSYKLTENFYQGKKSTVGGRGTYYLEVSDTYTTDNVPVYALLNITDSAIVVKQYSSNRNYYGQFIVSAKRSGNFADSSLDKDAFMEKLAIEADDNDYTKAILTVDKSGYGMVNSVKIYEGTTLLLDQWADSDIYNTYSFGGLTPNKDYSVKAVVDFKDGETKEINLSFSTSINYGKLKDVTFSLGSDKLTIRYTNDLRPATESVNIYINGVLAGEAKKDSKYTRVDASALTDGVNVIEFKAVDKDGVEHLIGVVNYGEAQTTYNLEVNKLEADIFEGETFKIDASVNNDGKIEYISSDESILTVSSTGLVTGLKKGVAIVTVKVVGTDIKKEVTITVKEKEVGVEKYTVTFKAFDEVILQVEVEKGTSVTAPTPPTKDGFNFIGWDKDFSVVNSNLEINAKYEKIENPDDDNPEPIITPGTDTNKGCKSGAIVSIWNLVLSLGIVLIIRRRRLY